MTWWQPVEVTDWIDHAHEPRGRRPKMWLEAPDGEIWLRKAPPPRDPLHPNTARRTEPAVELFALELAGRAGIPVAEARPAIWTGDQRGVVSRRFHGRHEEHRTGAELLGLPSESESTPEAMQRRRQARASATLERVRHKLREMEDARGVELVVPFTRQLAFDAWIGNGDHHSGNWAVVTGPQGARLAPMYDPTACLGVELTDERRELTRAPDALIARYAERCPSGFGGGIADGRPGISMSELLAKLESWPEWAAVIGELTPRFHALTGQAAALLDDIPSDWLSAERKRFASRLLAHRVRLLQ